MKAGAFMALNPEMVSVARQPRGIVKANDVRLDGWTRFEFDNNTYSEADTFRVTFALSDLPAAYNDAFWAGQMEVFIELFAGFPVDADHYSADDLKSWIYGRVDDVEYDPVARLIHVSGRDLTAILIDARTTESFQNLTSSQVATLLAERHGFTPVVTATKDIIGKFYELDTVKVNTQRSEWDILTQLASAEGYTVYVKGKELHFEPITPPGTNTYELKWEPPTDDNGAYGFNGKHITFKRALNIARGIVVEVTYTVPGKKGTFKVRYPNKSTGIKVGHGKSHAQLYPITVLNLSPKAALDRAQKEHAAITKHEVKMHASMPADDFLLPTSIITMTGTGTAFDQTYYPESVVREMDIDAGYSMSVHGKNHSPSTVVAL